MSNVESNILNLIIRYSLEYFFLVKKQWLHIRFTCWISFEKTEKADELLFKYIKEIKNFILK